MCSRACVAGHAALTRYALWAWQILQNPARNVHACARPPVGSSEVRYVEGIRQACPYIAYGLTGHTRGPMNVTFLRVRLCRGWGDPASGRVHAPCDCGSAHAVAAHAGGASAHLQVQQLGCTHCAWQQQQQQHHHHRCVSLRVLMAIWLVLHRRPAVSAAHYVLPIEDITAESNLPLLVCHRLLPEFIAAGKDAPLRGTTVMQQLPTANFNCLQV